MDADTDTLRCVGVVLAGGRSSRMGSDKALLDWCGRPLIEHQLQLLRAAGVDEVRVSGDRPDYHGIADPRPQLGPLGGLAGIAAALTGEAELLVIPVDMPLLDPTLLERLRTEFPRATALRYAGHVLPLRLRLDAHCCARLEAMLQAHEPRERSLRALQQAIGCEELPLPPTEAEQLADCDTRAQFERLRLVRAGRG